jgi:hypothetical protein
MCITRAILLILFSLPLALAAVSGSDTTNDQSDNRSSSTGQNSSAAAADEAAAVGAMDDMTEAEINAYMSSLMTEVGSIPGSGDAGLMDQYLEHSIDYRRDVKRKAADNNVELGGNERAVFGRVSVETVLNEAPVTRTDYLRAPQRVSFVKDGKNMLQGVQDKLDRAKETMEKIFPCSDFDWIANFSKMFNIQALKNYVKDLASGVAAAAPMALLQAFSPNLAEIVKHFKVIASFDLSANKMDCNQLQQTLTPAFGGLLRGPGYSECLNVEQAGGASMTEANKLCAGKNSAFGGMNIFGKLENVTENFATTASNLSTAVSVEEFAPFDLIATAVDRTTGAIQTAAEAEAAAANSEEANRQLAESETGDGHNASADKQMAQQQHSGDLTGLGNLLKETLGSVTVSAQGGLELGNMGGKTYKIRLRSQVIQVSENMVDQCLQYGAFIDSKLGNDWAAIINGADPLSADTMRQHREAIAVHCMYTLASPWDDMVNDDQEEVLFTYDTIDKLAHIVFRLQNGTYTEGGQVRLNIDGLSMIKMYRPIHAIETIVDYELKRFRHQEIYLKYVDEISQKVNGIMSDANAQKDYQARALEQWEAYKQRKAAELLADYENTPMTIRELVQSINRYRFPVRSNPGINPDGDTLDDSEKKHTDLTERGYN